MELQPIDCLFKPRGGGVLEGRRALEKSERRHERRPLTTNIPESG